MSRRFWITLLLCTIFLSVVNYHKKYGITEQTPIGEYLVPDTFLHSNYGNWQSLEKTLLNSPEKSFTFQWIGRGGNVDIAYEFINTLTTLQKQGKTIILDVPGLAGSMHALAICYANKSEFGEDTEVYFHDIASDFLGYVTYDDTDTMAVWYKKSLELCKTKGYLTEEQINDIINKHKAVVMTNYNHVLNWVIVEDGNR